MASWLERLGIQPYDIRSTKKTDWGELYQFSGNPINTGGYGDYDPGPQMGRQYGGAGLIFLGHDYKDDGGGDGSWYEGTSWAKVDPYLLQASQYGSWYNLRGDFQNKLNEVAGYSADALEQLNSIYDQLHKPGGYSAPFSWYPDSGDYGTTASTRESLMAALGTHAQSRQRYDNLVSQFNSVYTGAVQAHQQREREHQERLAELDRQRQAAEAAAARSRAWQSNMPLQNRQNENLPDTITSGTADSQDGGGDVGGDVGGKPRRRRGSLSSNLGINA